MQILEINLVNVNDLKRLALSMNPARCQNCISQHSSKIGFCPHRRFRLIVFSLLFTALTVRYLTRRYIGEYRSNTGE
jgi:hypothetical protein